MQQRKVMTFLSQLLLLTQSQDSCNHHSTVRKLLLHCVQLLDQTKHQDVASHAVCLLSTLFLPELKIGAHMDSQAESKHDCKHAATGFDEKIDIPLGYHLNLN